MYGSEATAETGAIRTTAAAVTSTTTATARMLNSLRGVSGSAGTLTVASRMSLGPRLMRR
ncbi:hypothetical protein [Nonomuraea indica]|uniref:hypothetical protein n=1 Tax=Nonomuraea indica TaxID=1581193 RepID=UPI000C7B2824|nr:hypothetical protein [Nonomuraea indica]